jgi:hypothetical protein
VFTDTLKQKKKTINLQKIPFDLQNQKYAPQETSLQNVWQWLRHNKSLEGELKIAARDRLYGLNQIFRFQKCGNYLKAILNATMRKSELNYSEWSGMDAGSSIKIPVYRSEERQKGLLLCEWGNRLHDKYEVYRLIERLESDGQYTRAAAIAVFNLNLKQAIDCLSKCSSASPDRGGDPHLSTVAMALSGFSASQHNSLWHNMCRTLKHKFTDPYLRCVFHFLTSARDSNYEEILFDKQLKLSDRLAFALMFLADTELEEYVQRVSKTAIEEGDLEALLLVGMSADGLRLLQRYVDRTSDVQTASLIVLHSLPNPAFEATEARLWVDQYKDFLDRQRMWHLTAQFNIRWHRAVPDLNSVPPQVFVNCNFCNHSVSSYLQLIGGREASKSSALPASQLGQHCGRVSVSAASNKTRVQSCPSCLKPLPRCALCSMHLGTSSVVYFRNHAPEDPKLLEINKKLSPFSSWFSWCQTCRHGGHSKHLLEWFADNLECPVNGCNCKCMSIDSASKFKASSNSNARMFSS